MFPSLVKNLIYPLHEALLSRPTFSYLRDLEQSQYLDRQGIEDIQMAKLKVLLRKAHTHCPWYTRLIEDAGIDLYRDQPLTMEELRRLPTMDKQTATERGSDMVWHDVPGGSHPYNTGGSSGEPLRFRFGRWRQASDAAGRMRARRWWGVDVGDREVYLWGAPVELNKTDRIKTLRDRLFNQMVLNAFEMSVQNMDAYIDAIRRYQPSCIYGYASSIALLATHARDRNKSLKMPSLRVVCTTGEPIYPHQRELLREVFGVPVANEFGSRDIGFTAHEAPNGAMLLMSESIILEVLDGDGNPVAPGTVGEAVMTGLCSEAQPFVRYRTGDMVTLSKEADPGGRGLHVIANVAGRNTDFVVRPDGAIMHALAVIYEIRDKPGVGEFKFVQHNLHNCEVQLIPGQGWRGAASEALLVQDLKARLGDEVNIAVSLVDRIPAEASGKHRYVVSKVPLPGGLDNG
jgi:phenylacetate-CoA ligase